MREGEGEGDVREGDVREGDGDGDVREGREEKGREERQSGGDE